MNTKTLSAPASLSYDQFLLDHLSDPVHSAAYLEAILEESDPEPQLLVQALQKILAARSEGSLTAEQVQQLQRSLEELGANQGREISLFIQLLQILGFRIQIQAVNPVKAPQPV